ncbi:hypothetical protein GCM10008097_07280 [Mycetocola manganoxydans]|nr:hypothetical protein GCM10008097_07280 [Mycetocola manganoxydans]
MTGMVAVTGMTGMVAVASMTGVVAVARMTAVTSMTGVFVHVGTGGVGPARGIRAEFV